jgi:membrane protein YqaA with SNARE-associated domain
VDADRASVPQRVSAWLFRLKETIESFAAKPYAEWVLFGMAFIEASLFPLPPDILFLALAVSRPASSFRYATVCILGSTAGAMLGYALGALLFDLVGARILGGLGLEAQMTTVLRMYHDHAWLTLLLAGFTNLPFNVFTIAAGFRMTLDPATLFFGALAGRALRFSLMALLLTLFGPSVKRLLDRYFPVVSFVALVLFIGALLLFHGGARMR